VAPLRILIIEDSLTITVIVTKLLEKKGHIVESEKNGFSGLNRLKEVFNTIYDFDLVLLDVQMPVLDGFECVSRYRAFEVEQIKNMNNNALNKSKTDTLKLLLHSNYFRVNYSNNMSNYNFNIDNFNYLRNTATRTGSETSEKGTSKSSNNRQTYYSDSVNVGDECNNKENDTPFDNLGSFNNSHRYHHDSGASKDNGESDVVLRRGNMAIVGMSADNDNESRILALRKGMNFFITKPFTGADLQNILNLFD
jgi:CheY-like chemotaxis protein